MNNDWSKVTQQASFEGVGGRNQGSSPDQNLVLLTPIPHWCINQPECQSGPLSYISENTMQMFAALEPKCGRYWQDVKLITTFVTYDWQGHCVACRNTLLYSTTYPSRHRLWMPIICLAFINTFGKSFDWYIQDIMTDYRTATCCQAGITQTCCMVKTNLRTYDPYLFLLSSFTQVLFAIYGECTYFLHGHVSAFQFVRKRQ